MANEGEYKNVLKKLWSRRLAQTFHDDEALAKKLAVLIRGKNIGYSNDEWSTAMLKAVLDDNGELVRALASYLYLGLAVEMLMAGERPE